MMTSRKEKITKETSSQMSTNECFLHSSARATQTLNPFFLDFHPLEEVTPASKYTRREKVAIHSVVPFFLAWPFLPFRCLISVEKSFNEIPPHFLVMSEIYFITKWYNPSRKIVGTSACIYGSFHPSYTTSTNIKTA